MSTRRICDRCKGTIKDDGDHSMLVTLGPITNDENMPYCCGAEVRADLCRACWQAIKPKLEQTLGFTIKVDLERPKGSSKGMSSEELNPNPKSIEVAGNN